MKLLYIVEDRFPPFRGDIVELFAKQMAARGHKIDWLMQRGSDAANEKSKIEWLGNTVYLTPRRQGKKLIDRIINNLLDILGDLMILPLAILGQHDVIQVRDKFFASLIAWFAARLTGARFVYWMSYPSAESKLYQAQNRLVPYRHLVWLKGKIIRKFLYKIILPSADHIFVQSQRMKENVAQQGISALKITPVPMGIRAEQVGHARDAVAPNQENPLLLHLGLIRQIRKSEILVRVLHRVKTRYPGARLIFVGDGQMPSDRHAIEDEAVRLGLISDITITGFLPMKEAWQLVKQADICFSPIYPSPVSLPACPTKLIEYMAMAKCVVANKLPEQCNIMKQSGIGLCVPWNEEAFADEVFYLLEDPERARKMASKGPDWVRENRTYDVIADCIESEYKKMLGKIVCPT